MNCAKENYCMRCITTVRFSLLILLLLCCIVSCCIRATTLLVLLFAILYAASDILFSKTKHGKKVAVGILFLNVILVSIALVGAYSRVRMFSMYESISVPGQLYIPIILLMIINLLQLGLTGILIAQMIFEKRKFKETIL